ncbi:DUF2285 domain-containing protein [Mesorhizobium sp. M2A.F.Ca.ET.042.01.1.1]|nr:DUF2285 domain-containing protein [Mesorhizobium sp. M2A.F.Ca.ET.042.01.1.1]
MNGAAPSQTLGTIKRDEDAGRHLRRDLGGGKHLTILRVDKARVAESLVALVPIDASGFGRAEAVLRLLASLHGRAVPPDTRMTHQQRRRARRMLQAVDGLRSGASQMDIAVVIFRLARPTRDEWQVAPERFAVMDLIRDGNAMIAGGYRALLRHRRKS